MNGYRVWLAGVLLLTALQSAWGFYNPQTGRWLSRDPLGDLGFQNVRANGNKRSRPFDKGLYIFAVNCPASYVDLLGLNVWSDLQSLGDTIRQASKDCKDAACAVAGACKAVGQAANAVGQIGSGIYDYFHDVAGSVTAYSGTINATVTINSVKKSRTGGCKICCCPPVPNWIIRPLLERYLNRLFPYTFSGGTMSHIVASGDFTGSASGAIPIPIGPHIPLEICPAKPTCLLTVDFSTTATAHIEVGN